MPLRKFSTISKKIDSFYYFEGVYDIKNGELKLWVSRPQVEKEKDLLNATGHVLWLTGITGNSITINDVAHPEPVKEKRDPKLRMSKVLEVALECAGISTAAVKFVNISRIVEEGFKKQLGSNDFTSNVKATPLYRMVEWFGKGLNPQKKIKQAVIKPEAFTVLF